MATRAHRAVHACFAPLLVLAFWLALAPGALARVDVPVPSGWTETRDTELLREAREWADAADARLVQSWSPAAAGREELMVHLHFTEPLPGNALRDQTGALGAMQKTIAAVLGSNAGEPSRFSIAPAPGATTDIVQAVWDLDEDRFRLLLVPAGLEHSIVVVATKAEDDALFRSTFSEVLHNIEGARPPVTPFPVSTLRLVAAATWVALTIICLILARRDFDEEGNRKRLGALMILLAVLLGAVGYAVLEPLHAELAAASASPMRIATEISIMGLVAAGVVLGLLSGLTKSKLYNPSEVKLIKVAADKRAKDPNAPAGADPTPSLSPVEPSAGAPEPLGAGSSTEAVELPRQVSGTPATEAATSSPAEEASSPPPAPKGKGESSGGEYMIVKREPGEDDATRVAKAPTKSDPDA